MRGFQKLVPVHEAQQTFLEAWKAMLRIVSVPPKLALNRVLAQDVVASTDLPRTDKSAVDGYAVYAGDAAGATQFKPKTFTLTHGNTISQNKTKQIWTGNPIPKGANAVVMLENTKVKGREIEVWCPVTRWENVSKKGEDIGKGEVALRAETRLKPQHLGLAAALGTVELKVFEKPRIAILATGNELTELGDRIQREQVFDSNRLVLSALCTELGAETLDLGIARDDLKEISEKLRLGIENACAIVTSGGTSVGGLDLVPEAVNTIGKPGVIVHGVAMRPGMPTALAVVRGKPIIILPGNPVAAMLGFEVFGRPLVSRLLGLRHREQRPVLKARITRRIATTLGRKNLVRVHVLQRNEEALAEPVSARGSSLISTMTRANGYVVVDESVEGLEKGDIVSVQMFDDPEVTDSDV